MRKRVAVIDREKCHPQECGNYLCAKLCPVNRAGADCIYPGDDAGKKARIDEMLCTSCGICPHRCPFGAIKIVNLPAQLDKPPIYRYGENMFELFSLPTAAPNTVTGIVGRNGIGKSTALKIMADMITPNLGRWSSPPDAQEVINYFKGTEMQKFMEQLHKKEVSLSYKPQQVDLIPKQFSGTVRELLARVDGSRIAEGAGTLQLAPFLDNDISTISGGELQRVAIAAAALKQANIYFFDEPTSYLDIKQRLRASEFIRHLANETTSVMVIEHDLIILDFITDAVNIMYGHEGVYGIVSGVKSTREGINAFLEGHLREENMRFRDYPLTFGKSQEMKGGVPVPLISWDMVKKKLGSFDLSTSRGTLHKGEIVGVLGENGIGKTTFIKILAGVIQADEGEITSEVNVAYKPQYLETESEMTVIEFLQDAVSRYSHQLIKPLGMESLFARKLSQLSGGELQRVAVARCLSQDARLFLLDEPSAYLDVEQRLLVSKIIKNIVQERGITVLVVDHDLMFLDYVSDRLIVFTGEPARRGELQGPFRMEEGMNLFLENLNITLRRDVSSHRPRINKPDSVKDREQREENRWYYG